MKKIEKMIHQIIEAFLVSIEEFSSPNSERSTHCSIKTLGPGPDLAHVPAMVRPLTPALYFILFMSAARSVRGTRAKYLMESCV